MVSLCILARMIKKIIGALILGISITFFLAQFDPWTHRIIIAMCKKISHDYCGCDVECSIESVNFFVPSIVFANITTTSHEKDAWSWSCKRCEITCSWLQLLLTGQMDRHMVMDGFDCFSSVSGSQCAIEPYVMALLQESFLPIAVNFKSHMFRNSTFRLLDSSAGWSVSGDFTSFAFKVGNDIRGTFSLFDGVVMHKGRECVTQCSLDVAGFARLKEATYDLFLNVTGTARIPFLGEHDVCYVTGAWNAGRGRCAVRNTHNTFRIDPIIMTDKDIRFDAHVPLLFLARCGEYDQVYGDIQGTVYGVGRILFDEKGTVDGQVFAQDVVWNGYDLCTMSKMVFSRRNNRWKSSVMITRAGCEFVGNAYWDEEMERGKMVVRNNTSFSYSMAPYWRSMRNECTGMVVWDCDEAVALMQARVQHVVGSEKHCLTGAVRYAHGAVTAHGFVDMNYFEGRGIVQPEVSLERFVYKDSNDNHLIAIHELERDQYKGTIGFSVVQQLLSAYAHCEVDGQGSIVTHVRKQGDAFCADCVFEQGAIRIPQMYNFVDGMKACVEYKPLRGEWNIHDGEISLHRGTITCSHASVYTDKQGGCMYVHAPILFDECLITIKKDLFAFMSGMVVCQKRDHEDASIAGHIIIDRAQLKENLFSDVVQKQLFSYTRSAFAVPNIPVVCDVSVETKAPVRVDTAFLQTNAHVRLQVRNTINDPAVSGMVTLQGGSLIFPYKPLYIHKGSLAFFPDQLCDPAIELVACNKIKKYDVTLQVAGSLLSHHSMLDATPPLSEEQIIALLLVGSEESLLNSMMPALVMQNIKKLIFSNNQSRFLEKYFKPLLRPFSIALVPSFSDQTGRGGLRGALEISVEDRWRAVIQKNFSLTEDTRFELEFFVSDDITLRGIRDERRDMGGEVEMRWKF